MKKVALITLAILLIGGLSAGGYYYLNHNVEDMVYEQKEVKRADVESVVIATGAIEPVNTVIVGTEVSGQISELLVDFNDAVEEEQIIARLDPRTFIARHQQRLADVESAEANLESRRAELTRANSNLTIAKNELNRRQELSEGGHVSSEELEQGKNALNQALAAQDIASASITSAEANLAQAKASLSQAELDLERTYIRSPINGTVINRAVEIGQTVAASFSAPELFVIAQDLHEMKVEASVDEADVGRLRTGLFTRFSVDAYPEREFSGRVSQIRKSPTVTQSVVTYKVIVTARNDDLALFPGMTANVEVVLGRREGVLTVPTSALRYTPRGEVAIASSSPASAPTRMGPGSGGGGPPQRGGGGMMSSADRAQALGEQLGLTESQISEVERIYEDASGRMRSMFASASQSGGPPFGGGSNMRQRMQNLMNTTNLAIVEILEGDQIEKFEEMNNMRGGNRRTVYVLNENGEETAKNVMVGLEDDSSAEILRGLEEGERVIVRARRITS